MTHLCIIINRFGYGGAERLAADEYAELVRRGHDVKVITLRPERGESFISEIPQRDRALVPFRSFFDLRAWMHLLRELNTFAPDIVITHLWLSNTIGRIAARLCGKAVISFEHNVYDEVKTRKQFTIDRLLQRISRRVIAVSDAVRDSLTRHGIAPERIAVIENGIDIKRYRDAPPGDLLRQGQGSAFLFVGRLIRQKGVDILLRAFAQISAGTLTIVGAGEDESALRELSGTLGLGGRVEFLGPRADVPRLMRSADCLVLPSRWEGQGLVVPEAFAAGIPVIVSDFPASHGLVSDGADGLVVPREDENALAEAMQRIEDGVLRARLAAGARARAEYFSISRHVDTLLHYV